jgi:hypothetical protein
MHGQDRLNWDAHIWQLHHDGTFAKEYLMSLPTNGRLVCVLDPILKHNEYNSQCFEPILVENIVATCISNFSAGRPKDNII